MGAKKERVVPLKGVPRVLMSDSGKPWNGVAPDGSPLIMSDVGSREIYSRAAVAVDVVHPVA
jgi:hypothetical protein